MKRHNYEYLPVCLSVHNKECFVVGGGRVASRKISVLRKFGANVTCLSQEFIKPLQFLAERKKIK